MPNSSDSYVPTLRDLLEINDRVHGDRTALVQDDRTVTHSELLTNSRKLASALAGLGVRPQDRVGMLGMNSIEYLVMYGACQVAGFIASTVNFRLAAAEMDYIINDAGQKVLILEEQYVPLIDTIRAKLASVETYVVLGKAPDWAVSFEDLVAKGDPDGPDFPAPVASDTAYLMYTSGTTGKPKGVMISNTGAVNFGRLCADGMRAGPEDRMLLMMPFFHVGAKALELAQSWVGGCVHIHSEFDPGAILRTFDEEKITLSHMAPAMIQMLLEHPDAAKYDVSSVRSIMYSAAAMPPAVLRKALDTFGSIFLQMYGQTEGGGTLLPAMAHKLDGDERDLRRLESIGFPAPGCKFSIRDEDNNECPTGTPGEICYRSPLMMTGYWNNSAATIEAMRGGWVHSGDIGKFDEDGYLYLVDRKKDMIISGGENIYSLEVENALTQHEDILEAAVIGVESKKWGEAVCAIVVLRDGKTLTQDDVIAHSRTLIAGYKRPQIVHFIKSLPRLVSGKVSKVDLRREFGNPLD